MTDDNDIIRVMARNEQASRRLRRNRRRATIVVGFGLVLVSAAIARFSPRAIVFGWETLLTVLVILVGFFLWRTNK